MFGPIKYVVFDFDGTLVDTMPSVIRGLGEAVKFATGQLPTTEELLKTFGPAPQDVLKKWMPAEKVSEAFQHWLNFENTLGGEDMVAFAEVEEMLAGLKTLAPIAIFTGRDRAGTLKILEARDWLGKFFSEQDLVCGDDGFKTKPEPDALNHLLKTKNWKAQDTLMVGDHPYDMMAGRAAGTKTAAVLWDMPTTGRNARRQYKDSWEKWDSVDCDLRLATPLSLLRWMQGSDK